MQDSIFVISDLHLGGAAGFQMCSARGRSRLAALLRWITSQRTVDQNTHLVLAGDIVDFLAERPWEAFTADNERAESKLTKIFESTTEVWDALRDFVRGGSALTLLLGNHDLELSLPGPRRLLLDRLGGGRVEFLYDNQAFVHGPVFIEHGNRHDHWNVVQHDSLRKVRSSLSRLEEPAPFPAPAGSRLVVEVMNEVKEAFPFIDLLKPESEASLPLLAAVDPTRFAKISNITGFFFARLEALNSAAHPSWKTGSGSGNLEVEKSEREAQVALREAREIAGAVGAGATGLLSNAARALADLSTTARIDVLFRTLRFFAKRQAGEYRTNFETHSYLQKAEQAVQGSLKRAGARAFEVIIFGHTHLARRVPLSNNAVYLNTGTWADLMSIPESILADDVATAKDDLAKFVTALETKQFDGLRKFIPSYARVDLKDGSVVDRDVWLFRSVDLQERLPTGSLWAAAE